MVDSFHSTRDVIIRTETFDEAVRFYETVLGLPVTLRKEGLVGFETGSFPSSSSRAARLGADDLPREQRGVATSTADVEHPHAWLEASTGKELPRQRIDKPSLKAKPLQLAIGMTELIFVSARPFATAHRPPPVEGSRIAQRTCGRHG